MRIIYIAIWDDPREDYSLNPKSYGSAPIFARYAKELLNNSHDQFALVVHQDCLRNLRTEERVGACIGLNLQQYSAIRAGVPLKDIIYDAEKADIIVHHCSRYQINMQGLEHIPIAFWSCNGGESEVPMRHQLFYTNSVASWGHTYRIKIGRFVPDRFQYCQKKNFIFQCSRVDDVMNQRHVIEFCIKHRIMYMFAGRIAEDYRKYWEPLVDNKIIHYLGEISHEENIALCRRARLYTLCQASVMPFSISAIEALSSGTPVVAPKGGAFPDIIKEGINGFFWTGDNLKAAWDASENISPVDCWESSKQWSHLEMISSFRRAFEDVIASHRREMAEKVVFDLTPNSL